MRLEDLAAYLDEYLRVHDVVDYAHALNAGRTCSSSTTGCTGADWNR